MLFPEQQLITYLRVFLPDTRIDGMLDAIAEAALESDVTDVAQFFWLAHWLMDTDERRTVAMEAVVLVEEVGLSAADVAVILDADVEDIACAVDSAWVEEQDLGTPPVTILDLDDDEAELPGDSLSATAGPVDDPQDEPAPQDEPDPGTSNATHPVPTTPSPSLARTTEAQKAPDQTARSTPSFGRVAVTVVVVAILGLGVAVFSDAGQARLMSQGFNPLIAFLVVVGFLGIGLSLVFAGGSAVRMSEDATVPAEDAQ